MRKVGVVWEYVFLKAFPKYSVLDLLHMNHQRERTGVSAFRAPVSQGRLPPWPVKFLISCWDPCCEDIVYCSQTSSFTLRKDSKSFKMLLEKKRIVDQERIHSSF